MEITQTDLVFFVLCIVPCFLWLSPKLEQKLGKENIEKERRTSFDVNLPVSALFVYIFIGAENYWMYALSLGWFTYSYAVVLASTSIANQTYNKAIKQDF